MHWETGTVWEPWSCSCSADARCPISYSQHSTKQNYSTATNTNAYTLTHTHAVVQLRKREEGNNNVPFTAWRSMINLGDIRRNKYLVFQLTLQVECPEKRGQISIHVPTWFFASLFWFQFLSSRTSRRPSILGKLSIIANRSRSLLLCRNELHSPHKSTR